MLFTVNNVLSTLMPFHGRPYIPHDDPKTYRWASLIPEKDVPLQKDLLYIGRLSEALQRNREERDCHFVCLCDRYLNDEERDDNELLHGIILIEENRSVTWLYELIQSRFLELNCWESKMKDALLRDDSFQTLLDISENYLKNALFILDAAYHLVAYSKTFQSDDPLNRVLYENGYYPSETLEKWFAHGIFEKNYGKRRTVVGTPGQISGYETLSKWCLYAGEPQLHIVEVFYQNPMRADSEELFELLFGYIDLCLQREQKKSQDKLRPYTRLLMDILYGDLCDAAQIGISAKAAGIPEGRAYNAYRIVFRSSSKVLVGRFLQELSGLLPKSRIVAKDYEISALNVYGDENIEKESGHNLQKIRNLLEKHDAICGISAPFTSLSDFRFACEQAAWALKCVQAGVVPLKERPDSEVFFAYEDAFLYHVVCNSEKGTVSPFKNSVYLKKIMQLQEYDQQHETNLTEILYRYLIHERRTTAVSQILHMHRSTVMYHVDRIALLLDLNLDDYAQRQGLLLSMHFLDINKNSST